MKITNITRSYSHSVNTRAFSLPESWIKAEATYTVEVDILDTPEIIKETTESVDKMCRDDVTKTLHEVIEECRQSFNTKSA